MAFYYQINNPKNKQICDNIPMQPDQPNSTETPIEQTPTEEIVASRLVRFWRFTVKHRLPLLIITVFFALTTVLFFVIPVIAIGSLKLVNLDTTVKIENGQTIRLKTADISVVIDRYVNDECPVAGTCYGSDQTAAVFYKLNINGTTYAITSTSDTVKTPYKIETTSSDYKTYAEIKITKSL